MRILILGGTGMLGHKLWQTFRNRFDTWITVRSSYHEYAGYGFFDPQRILEGVDVFDFDTVVRALADVRPDVVINSIGIIKQLPTAKDPIVSLTINSLFPHRLTNLCRAAGARLIHISTDCVFSGRKGMYTENDVADAEDLYGRSKYLGEVDAPGCLTLRTSIIGRELKTSHGLLEWFLSNRGGQVQGYKNAIYTGFPTIVLARIIGDLIACYPTLAGLYHLASPSISKYELLCKIRDAMKLDITIIPYDSPPCDRSLNAARFVTATGYCLPTWDEMIAELAADPTPYDEWRQRYGNA